MKKTWIILKNELYNVIMRRSFILTLILIPTIRFYHDLCGFCAAA